MSNKLSKTTRGTGGFGSTNKKKDVLFINRVKARTAALENHHIKTSLTYLHTSDDSETKEDAHLYPTIPPAVGKDKSYASVRPVNTPMTASYSLNKSLPATTTYSTDFFSQATGFYNNNNLIQHLSKTGLHNVTIQKNDPPLSDEGTTATMRSRKRNTKPSTTAHLQYSDVWHVDIGFGPTTAIGGFATASC